MDLHYRRLESADIDACISLTFPPLNPQGRTMPRRPEIWQHLLKLPTLNSMVLEDWERPPGKQILAFGASLFVSDRYMAQARSADVPDIVAPLYQVLHSKKSPVLSLAEIRDANSAGGLNLLVLHYGEAPHLLLREKQAVREKQPETFFFAHAGYQIKEFLSQTSNDEFYQFSLASGFRLRNDYRTYFQGRLPPAECRPALLGLAREEIQMGSYASAIFAYTPPRLFFTLRQQEMLTAALAGARDEQIANQLCLSVSAVKKRWIGIYARVAVATPSLLPESKVSQETTRGAEKRRHLLNYLRLHPEEMRPVKPRKEN